MLRAFGAEATTATWTEGGAPVAAAQLQRLRGLDGGLDGALSRPEASRWWTEVLQRGEGAWYSRLDSGATHAQSSFIGAFARVPDAVASLARAGERNAVNHCLRHPGTYAHGWSFRQQTLEAVRLDRLLHGAEARGPTAVHEHVWEAEGLRAEYSWPGPTLSFDLHEARWLPHTPGDQACVDEARVRAYFGTGQPAAELRQLGCSYPALVLTSLLQRGEAGAAEELLDAGCVLPRLVVERWSVSEVAGESDDGSEGGWGMTEWRSCRSPLSACLRGAGWRPTPLQRRVAHALLARGARPTVCERFRLMVAYRRPPRAVPEETERLLGHSAAPRPA